MKTFKFKVLDASFQTIWTTTLPFRNDDGRNQTAGNTSVLNAAASRHPTACTATVSLYQDDECALTECYEFRAGQAYHTHGGFGLLSLNT